MLGLGLKQAGSATGRLGIAWLALVIGLTATMPALSIDAQRASATLIPIRKVTAPPPGANGLCATYDWACAKLGQSLLMGESSLQVLRSVNAKANRAIRPVTDLQQYRIAERWALPTKRGGDCEDYVLYKKQARTTPDRGSSGSQASVTCCFGGAHGHAGPCARQHAKPHPAMEQDGLHLFAHPRPAPTQPLGLGLCWWHAARKLMRRAGLCPCLPPAVHSY
jgi:predicted transglutaminase-like cysteine proteinase